MFDKGEVMNKIVKAYKELTAEELAQKCGVGIQTVYGWRTASKQTKPAVISIVRLAVAMGATIAESGEAIKEICGAKIEG